MGGIHVVKPNIKKTKPQTGELWWELQTSVDFSIPFWWLGDSQCHDGEHILDNQMHIYIVSIL